MLCYATLLTLETHLRDCFESLIGGGGGQEGKGIGKYEVRYIRYYR